MELLVWPDGEVTTLYTELLDLAALGALNIARASQVEPDATGQWFAHVIDGPKLGPFSRRSEALAAEVAWLTEHRLHSPHQSPLHSGETASCNGPGLSKNCKTWAMAPSS